MKPPPTLRRFVVATFLWLPPCFALWHWTSAWHTQLLGWLARPVLGILTPGLLSAVERSGHELTFVSTVSAQGGMLVGEVNALTYSFGLPLYLALVLAGRARWQRALLGAAALMPLQAACIALAFLVQFVAAGAAAAAAAGLVGWRAEALALAYQLGTLVLPGLAPLVLWAIVNREVAACLGGHGLDVRDRTDLDPARR